MKKTDALWLLALPIYQIIGTARHELSHAAVATLQGARITDVQLLPSIHPHVGFLWGYVNWTGGHTNWVAMAAPYFCDLLVFGIFLLLCSLAASMPRWLWINCFVVGLVSPLINTVYNYQKVFTRRYGDVNYLMSRFPNGFVHAAFLITIALFCIGIWAALRAFRRARSKQKEAPTTASSLPSLSAGEAHG